MSRRPDYTAAARADLARIWEHYAERATIRAADSMIERIEGTVYRTIVRHPSAGRVRPEFGSGIRSFAVVPYVVLYSIEARHVRVVRVLHGHRDIRQPLMSLLVA